MDIVRFKERPLMGILRGVDAGVLPELIETVIQAGLSTLEITMNTPDALALIRLAVKCGRGRLMIGAGTVLSKASVQEALAAGATFIVSPVVVDEVMEYCVQAHVPVFAGALSPQEIWHAWNRGATMVKVFPAQVGGPSYFREIKGPFSDISLLACGGVSPDTIISYFVNGASAVAVGGNTFKHEWLVQRDFKSICVQLTQLVDQFLQYKKIRKLKN